MILENLVIDRSGNHVHLTEKDAKALFGHNVRFETKELAIKGEFLTNLKVYDKYGNKYSVLFPFRSYSQLELCMSDYFKIFKKYTNRTNSGENLNECATLEIKGTNVEYINIPVIVPKAHIHVPNGVVHIPSELQVHYKLDRFLFSLEFKENETTDGLAHIHIDNDQYNAIQGL